MFQSFTSYGSFIANDYSLQQFVRQWANEHLLFDPYAQENLSTIDERYIEYCEIQSKVNYAVSKPVFSLLLPYVFASEINSKQIEIKKRSRIFVKRLRLS